MKVAGGGSARGRVGWVGGGEDAALGLRGGGGEGASSGWGFRYSTPADLKMWSDGREEGRVWDANEDWGGVGSEEKEGWRGGRGVPRFAGGKEVAGWRRNPFAIR